MSAKDSGAGWALDELFMDQPKTGVRLEDAPPGITDIALLGWLDFMAKDLIAKSRLGWQSYAKNLNALLRPQLNLGEAYFLMIVLLREQEKTTTHEPNVN